jgi:integrase/recombinase XerD
MRGLPPRLHLPFGQWPAADQRLWADAMSSNDDPFCDAPGARLAEATRQKYLFGWRRFLGFLAIFEPSALGADPAERLTIASVRSYVSHLAETNGAQSVAIRIDALYQAARIMIPRQEWSWLKIVKARLYAAAPARGRAGPVITSVQLIDLGQELMDESLPNTSIRMADAIRYRDGLMIALLGFRPLRRKNLAALEIGRHLIREGDGWFLIVPRTEVKKGTSAIEFAIPEFLSPYLATYLDVVRPRMLRRPTCNALWVSPCGDALTYSAIWPIFIRHTVRRLGIHIAPHDTRDAAATTWAVAAPDQIGVARDLLGHSDLRTTTRHYNRARGVEASRAYALVIKGMRRKQYRGPLTPRNARRENCPVR